MSNPKKPKVTKNTLKTAKRLLGYVTSRYKIQFVAVFICIIVSSIASISVSLSLKFLLDDFILPLIGQQDPNFSELYHALSILAISFMAGGILYLRNKRILSDEKKLHERRLAIKDERNPIPY